MMGHPSKQELMAYAEGLVDAQAAFAGPVARHVHACRRCAAEVADMRRSLRTLAEAPDLAPAAGAAEEILLAARQARAALTAGRAAPRATALQSALKGLAYAATLVLVAGLSFWSAIREPRAEASAAANGAALYAAVPLPTEPDAVHEAAMQVQALTDALAARREPPASYADLARLRAVLRLDADISEAMAALEVNPANEQARRLVDVNRRRQAETLRRLYAERSL